mmetsp:Transcript_22806/g.63331  ORF Transcript_22806/g.63331 Transcript_22806/m.63331 type:complete len:247 (-) Transcript_22806:176-916(-)
MAGLRGVPSITRAVPWPQNELPECSFAAPVAAAPSGAALSPALTISTGEAAAACSSCGGNCGVPSSPMVSPERWSVSPPSSAERFLSTRWFSALSCTASYAALCRMGEVLSVLPPFCLLCSPLSGGSCCWGADSDAGRGSVATASPGLSLGANESAACVGSSAAWLISVSPEGLSSSDKTSVVSVSDELSSIKMTSSSVAAPPSPSPPTCCPEELGPPAALQSPCMSTSRLLLGATPLLSSSTSVA